MVGSNDGRRHGYARTVINSTVMHSGLSELTVKIPPRWPQTELSSCLRVRGRSLKGIMKRREKTEKMHSPSFPQEATA